MSDNNVVVAVYDAHTGDQQAVKALQTVLAAGPVVAWIVGTLEGAVLVGGVGAVGAGLYSVGLPKDSVPEYEVAPKRDRFLLLVHETAAEAARAAELLKETVPAKLHTYPLQAAEREPMAADWPPENQAAL